MQSLCPVCLKRLDAVYEEFPPQSGEIVMRKFCPEHGEFVAPVWRGEPALANWHRPKTPSFPEHPGVGAERGCPFDCGLCPDHAQHTCTGQIEVTQRCDLGCPICYASSEMEGGPEDGTEGAKDETRERIAFQLESLWRASGACNVQLSGGEPTMREDLPEIVAMARRRGFAFVQLNSNGLRLGREAGYASRLREAGLDSVYLQFDGPDDDVFSALRGRPLLESKLEAVRRCAEAGLGVVLVATLVPGVNTGTLGKLLRLALELGPAVRGLHMQPVSSFGRVPWKLPDAPRLTLPEIMRELARQSDGLLSVTDFHPPGCEHSMCSFSAVYRRAPRPDGGTDLALIPAHDEGTCCCGPGQSAAPTAASGITCGDAPDNAVITAAEGARVSREFTARHWRAPETTMPGTPTDGAGDDFDRFLAKAGLAKRFTISCMAFQDAGNLDIARVRGCCIHVVTPDGRLVPFCLHNLTATDGTPLYRGISPSRNPKEACEAGR